MAVSVTTLASFDGTDGKSPTGELVMDGSGNLFGTTTGGGSAGDGTVFEIPAAGGQINDLHGFSGSNDGENPLGSLSMDAAGDLYGTTAGSFNSRTGAGSTVFVLTSSRNTYAFQTISDLGGSVGSSTYSGVNVALDGTITGTTVLGGTNDTGTVFTIAPNGTTPQATSFPAGTSSGSPVGPDTPSAPIEYGTGLYGTTYGERTPTNPGTIFAFDPQTATISTVATFDDATGYGPNAGVVADSMGNFYGTTTGGAANMFGSIYEYDAATHSLETLAPFSGTSGSQSVGNLLRDDAGDLFGTTMQGGADNDGTVFELKAGSSTIDVLYNFTGTGSDGAAPEGGLIADKAGNLYGVTTAGGTGFDGTVYEVEGTDFMVCFASGTRIRVARGQATVNVAVEDLAVGDLAVTASGASRPIRWLGHRAIDCAAQARPSESWPVRIRAGAFGPKLPARSLRLSPGHPVLVGADADNRGGVLVPIMCLINGTTIDRAPCDSVTYWHVELDSHDILLAEGLPAESYIDLGSRAWFAGAQGTLYDPDLALPGQPGRSRPVATEGPMVEGERRRLDRVFETTLVNQCAWPVAALSGAAWSVDKEAS